MRAGMSWLEFVIFAAPATLSDSGLWDRTGVVRVTVGRLKAAGSMSGMMAGGGSVACGEEATRDAPRGS